MMPSVSVVIPTYNRENWIERTLRSLYAQGVRDMEVIVVDDASTDTTLEKVKKFRQVILVRQLKNKGPAVCRNVGIQLAKGSRILLLDSDVVLEKGCLNALLGAKADIAFPQVLFENGTVFYPTNEKEKRYVKVSTAFVVKKESLRKLDNLFDEKYYFVEEDTDFFLRCRYFGLTCQYVPSATATHLLKEQKEFLNMEQKYYLSLRNHIYSYLKLGWLPKGIRQEFESPRWSFMGKLLAMAALNLNRLSLTDGKHEEKRSRLQRYAQALRGREKITERSRLVLWGLALKAVAWNVQNYQEIRRERQRVRAHPHEGSQP